jgi:hypothetical protein
VRLFTSILTGGGEILSERKPFLKPLMEYVRAGLKVRGVGVDHVNLGGNSDTVGMHKLQKIASLIEFMRNS